MPSKPLNEDRDWAGKVTLPAVGSSPPLASLPSASPTLAVVTLRVIISQSKVLLPFSSVPCGPESG